MNKYDMIKIPNNLDEITDKTINKASLHLKKRKANYKIIKIAAAVVLLSTIGLGISNPVTASSIPILGDIFEYLHSSADSKSTYQSGDEYKNCKTLNTVARDNGITITLSQVSCDGNKASVSYLIEGDNPLRNPNAEGFSLYPEIKLNNINTRLEVSSIEGNYLNENTFAGMQTIDLSQIDKDNLDLDKPLYFSLKISEVIFASSDENEPYTKIYGAWNFNFETMIDTSNNIDLKPNLTNNSCTLKEVLVTPSSTKIIYESSAKLPSGAIIDVIDNNNNHLYFDEGHELESNGVTTYTWSFPKVDENATCLRIVIFDKNTENNDIISDFNINIK
ncbi:MAG: DUF4179 domain-containing protein [Clostridiaceae bacterium]|nr:DUF4179 domain-containing protein [Clostridiaceae bacterium]